MMHWGNFEWGMGFGWISMLIFWAVVISAIVLFVNVVTRRQGWAAKHKTPLDILKHRYARGEITKEQYERMKDDLMKK